MPGKVGVWKRQEYVGHRNKVHTAVLEGPPCPCRFKYLDIVSTEESMKMQNAFYNLLDSTSHSYIIETCLKPVDKRVNVEKEVPHSSDL
jgi:hypothetical protein